MQSRSEILGMDTRFVLEKQASSVRWIICFLAIILFPASSSAQGNYRTRNFLIHAANPMLAKQVGDAAERFRTDLAIYWLGYELDPWPNPCPIRVLSGPNRPAQGETNYVFGSRPSFQRQGKSHPVRDFQMRVEGTETRVLDSVLPHEVTHTILATHFGRPLPRWADEGLCTTVEHVSEKSKHNARLRQFLRTNRGIAMNKLFLLKEYPADILPMYSQGYSVCQFLIAQSGPRAFIQFLETYMRKQSWTASVEQHYGYKSLAEFQKTWVRWVGDGGGPVERYAKHRPRAIPTPRQSIPLVGPATALASAGEDGWYARLRQEAIRETRQRDQSATVSSLAATTPLGKSRYSTSHPRPEQHLGPKNNSSYEKWPSRNPIRGDLPSMSATQWR